MEKINRENTNAQKHRKNSPRNCVWSRLCFHPFGVFVFRCGFTALHRQRRYGDGTIRQRLVRHDKRIGDQRGLVVDQVRDRRPGSTCTAKISCTASSNLTKATVCPVSMFTTQTPQARSGQRPLGDGDAAEDGALAHLRQADEGQRTAKVQAAGEAGQLGQRLVSARGRIDDSRCRRCRIRAPTAGRRTSAANAASTARERRLRSAATSRRMPPSFLSARQPPRRVGLAQGGDVARPAIDHAQAIEVAAVLRAPGR